MISIIIPVYNTEQYLEKCLESIMVQTYKDYEIIAVNDGSTDHSYEILCRYEQRYPSVFKIFTQENQGQSVARNLAMQHVSGEYVTFLDSDDYLAQDYLEVLVSAAEQNRSDMVCSGEIRLREDGEIVSEIRYKVDRRGNCALRRLNFSGKIYRKDFLDKHHIRFAEGKVYEDNPFNMMTFALAKNLVIIDYIGYYQIVHVGSTTTRKILEERLPFDEIERVIRYVNNHRAEANDYALFEYTVLSFFTYFLLKANKQHYYFDIQGRKSDQEVVYKICDYMENMVLSFFPDYMNNSYIRRLKGSGISVMQRMGVLFLTKLIGKGRLKQFIKMYYRY